MNCTLMGSILVGITLSSILLFKLQVGLILAFSLFLVPLCLHSYAIGQYSLLNGPQPASVNKIVRSHATQTEWFAHIAFGYWLIASGIKVFLIFILFGHNPLLGTFISSCITLAFAYLVFSLTVLDRSTPIARTFQPLAPKALVLFLLWSGLTLFWTRPASIISSLGYWATMTLDILVVFLLCGTDDLRKVMHKSLQGIVLGGLSIFLVASFFQIETIHSRLGDAEFLNPNIIGRQIALSALCCLYLSSLSIQSPHSKVGWTFLTGLLALALLQTLSKSSILAFLVAAIAFIFLGRFRRQEQFLIGFSFIIVTTLSYDKIVDYTNQYVHETQAGEALETLSGRTMIWEHAWKLIQTNPIWGFGFYSFRDYSPITLMGRLVHAHNEWLNIWFNVGIIGVILAATLYLSFFTLTWTTRSRTALQDETALALSLILFYVILGLTEANPRGLNFPLPLLMLFIRYFSEAIYPCDPQKNFYAP